MTNNDELALKTRKDFEAYYNETHALKATSQFKRFGYYVSPTMQKAWELWQVAQSSLLAERDADKKRIAEQQDIIAKQEKWIKDVETTMISATDRAEAAEKLVAELERDVDAANARVDTKCAQLCNQDEEIEMLSLRIAELEARTVSVKLPENIPCPGAPQTIWLQTNGDDSNESSWPENSNDVSWCWEKMFHNDTLYVRADLAAGIKLEVGE